MMASTVKNGNDRLRKGNRHRLSRPTFPFWVQLNLKPDESLFISTISKTSSLSPGLVDDFQGTTFVSRMI